jgi:hypothetical protein
MPGSLYDVHKVFEDLQHHLVDVVNGVQDAKELRSTAFEQMEELSRQLTILLKGHELILRYILQKLSQASSVLDASAAYMPTQSAQQKVLSMSEAVQMTSSLILLGECHDDRKPGVPRVF